MKKTLTAILLSCIFASTGINAQQKGFHFDDYFYYRNHLYLQTPSVLLNAAGLKAAAKDTAASIAYITKAAKAGLFDTGFITAVGRTSFITKRKEWSSIRNIILANAAGYASPEKMLVSFSDIDNFWRIYDRLDQPGADSILMNEYVLKGSTGLRTFFEKRMGLQPINLLAHIRKKKKYFASIRSVSLNLYRYKPAIIAAAKKIKELYAEAIFPPTYFTIGAFDAFGTADGGAGQLVGAEFLMDGNRTDTSELTRFEKFAVADSSRITGIIIHELIHTEQQTAADNTLLAMAVNEGAADFITQLALGYNINSKIHAYGNLHQKTLWAQFSEAMYGTETQDWLYNGMNVTGDRPADLGYYIGYKICEAFYNKASDKKAAVKEILQIRDFKAFLQKSGYDGGIQ